MSSVSSKTPAVASAPAGDGVNWHPLLGVFFVLVVYFVAQFAGAIIVSIYPALKHWSSTVGDNWINNSINAQFVYVLLAEGVSVLLLWGFLHHYRRTFRVLGVLKPKIVDGAYALIGLAIYFPSYIIVAEGLSNLIHGLNVNQTQQIGFTNAVGAGQLFLVFVSLVILPPIVEELLFRGFLFGSLRSKLSFVWAGLITSVLFAAPHLLEGGSGGLLWIAAIDTFILSLVLVWLREKTGRLYAGMGLHALKNAVAFFALFIAPQIHLH